MQDTKRDSLQLISPVQEDKQNNEGLPRHGWMFCIIRKELLKMGLETV